MVKMRKSDTRALMAKSYKSQGLKGSIEICFMNTSNKNLPPANAKQIQIILYEVGTWQHLQQKR